MNETESWNGSAWTEVADLNTGRSNMAGAGTYTAGLCFGRYTPTGAGGGQTESWNGSTWTEVNDLNTPRGILSGFGLQTSALAAGGFKIPPSSNLANVEDWNGASWAEVADISTARRNAGEGGTTSSGFIAGGDDPSRTNVTEEWSSSSTTIKVLTD